MPDQLRPYQKNGITQIFEAWDPKRKNLMNVLFQMPTGTGKTHVFSEIVRKAHLKKKKVLLVVHRKELVEQIVERLQDKFEVEVGVILAGTKPDPDKNIQVASIQTLSRRKFPPADIVIIDECHHSKAATYKKLWEIYPDARFLGVTANPVRLNGEGFDDQYQILIPLGKLSYFFEKGYLARIKHLVGAIPDLSKVKKKMRDYDLQMLRNVMLANHLMADLVKTYKNKANGKKTIVFAVDVEHSKSIVQRYNGEGIAAAHVDANTPKEERKSILEKFKKGEILILSNVDIVSEGFDVPDCEAVQLARPTKSLVLYLQQVGRCMRPAPGKEFGLVLDNAGLWLEHGLSYVDREWTLEGVKKRKGTAASKEIIVEDEEGIVRKVKAPHEAEGLELMELTEELERLLIFESFISFAKSKDHKLISAVYKYREYLIERRLELSDTEASYCHKRLATLGNPVKKGFWYHLRKDIREEIKASLKVEETSF
ncbi:DEAD/DEAH box helicase [Salibacter halophilus]|uniref:DEAD/DEAH box helicase n=1 Tax=Salibacter halophilus TaxID=1803916 RepID=A0A6N6M9E8_9FLAO|nr:DEAD/DEAH box helicase [Salibacter halophilus]KAB1065129.1 DEAD/DEAH box helicase [Salibacter halophilus]